MAEPTERQAKSRRRFLAQAARAVVAFAIPVATHGVAHAQTEASDKSYSPDVERRAKSLEAQLIPPCCEHQTLDVHQSPVADEMRAEVRERLAAGQTEEGIKETFRQRYGDKVIAVSSLDGLNNLGFALAGLSGVGAIGAYVMLRKWQRRSEERVAEEDKQAKKKKKPKPKDDAKWDERLDEELAALDDGPNG